ncbi:MAG: hypothetical protein HXY22_09990 [Alphaproteobacteria bacterium]|nr:hypothetical protein [Alphaproteobacteria bacterium]
MRLVVAVFAVLALSVGPAFAGATWKITKTEWTAEDEEGFSSFVTALGESNCSTAEECFASSANPFRDTDPRGLRISGDCADLPYLMRAYYAWKHGLPFSFAAAVSPRAGGGGDIRFNTSGNRIVARRDVRTGDNAQQIFDMIKNSVSSATFRVAHTFDSGAGVTDFYSPKIDKGSIRPGTVIYDINGHVTIVYKIDPDGRIRYMDSHPDLTLTRSTFGAQFMRDDPVLGSGFKTFRPVKLVGATRGGDGVYRGGRVVFASNEQIADFSPEQYVGNAPDADGNWRNGKFVNEGIEVGFVEYTRLKLSDGKLLYDPLYELRASMRSICSDLRDRGMAVDAAIDARINIKDQPGRLPDNIYGTNSMEWEIYSTPSRDARLKTRFKEVHDNMAHLLDLYQKRDPRVAFDGVHLKDKLIEAFEEESAKCRIVYTNSNGQPVVLTYEMVMRRLFDLSFDPYHCIERRWGAKDEKELESCDDDGTKRRWYEAEQRLRNQIDRKYDQVMNFDLGDLRDEAPGSGVDSPPNVDVKSLIMNLGPRQKFEGMKPVGL